MILFFFLASDSSLVETCGLMTVDSNKDLVLMSDRPRLVPIGIGSDHRQEMKLPVTAVLYCLGDAVALG